MRVGLSLVALVSFVLLVGATEEPRTADGAVRGVALGLFRSDSPREREHLAFFERLALQELGAAMTFISRRMRSLPPGQSEVTILLSPRPAWKAASGMVRSLL